MIQPPVMIVTKSVQVNNLNEKQDAHLNQIGTVS